MHLMNTRVILLSPTYFGEFITCNIFRTTQNFALKFSASTQYMIFNIWFSFYRSVFNIIRYIYGYNIKISGFETLLISIWQYIRSTLAVNMFCSPV